MSVEQILKHIFQLTLFVFLLFIAESGKCSDKIILGYTEFPPYTFTSEKGLAKGIYIDKAKQTLLASGIDFETRSLPAKRLYHALSEGKIDLFLGINTSPLIKGKIISSQNKLGNIALNIYYIGNEKIISGREALIGKRVALLNGYSYGTIGEFVTKHSSNLTYINSHKSGFLMLNRHRIDFFLDYEGPGQQELDELKIDNIKKHELFSLDVYFNLSKSASNAENIMKKIEQNFNHLYPTILP